MAQVGIGRIARLICGRRTKWAVLATWVILVVAIGPLAGKLADVQKNDTAQWLPGRAESTQVLQLQERRQSTRTEPAVIVYERASGVTAADRAKAAADAGRLAGVEGGTGTVVGPLPARDGRALQLVVPVAWGNDGWQKSAARVDAIRAVVGGGADGLQTHVAGPVGLAADQAKAFTGIDRTLLLGTLAIVIAILLVTYRSPVLWLLPVLTAGLALSSAQAVI